jgi:hypothetical protein
MVGRTGRPPVYPAMDRLHIVRRESQSVAQHMVIIRRVPARLHDSGFGMLAGDFQNMRDLVHQLKLGAIALLCRIAASACTSQEPIAVAAIIIHVRSLISLTFASAGGRGGQNPPSYDVVSSKECL